MLVVKLNYTEGIFGPAINPSRYLLIFTIFSGFINLGLNLASGGHLAVLTMATRFDLRCNSRITYGINLTLNVQT